jgi:hypothetical protein
MPNRRTWYGSLGYFQNWYTDERKEIERSYMIYLVEFIYDMCKSLTKVVTAENRKDATRKAKEMLRSLKAYEVYSIVEMEDM